jgi:hypothetical protein
MEKYLVKFWQPPSRLYHSGDPNKLLVELTLSLVLGNTYSLMIFICLNFLFGYTTIISIHSLHWNYGRHFSQPI